MYNDSPQLNITFGSVEYSLKISIFMCLVDTVIDC